MNDSNNTVMAGLEGATFLLTAEAGGRIQFFPNRIVVTERYRRMSRKRRRKALRMVRKRMLAREQIARAHTFTGMFMQHHDIAEYTVEIITVAKNPGGNSN